MISFLMPIPETNSIFGDGQTSAICFHPLISDSFFMTVSAAPKARKTRTRKPKATAVKTAVRKAPRKVASKSNVKAVKSVKRPSTAKLITPTRYLADIKTRWQIHNYEIQELISDLTKGFNIARPYAQQLVNQFKN